MTSLGLLAKLKPAPPIKKNKDYMVEESGRIWSRKTNELVKGTKQSKGYLQLADGTLVHRLVAELWVPGKTIIHNQINHKDGNKHNNSASNLEWCTGSQNMKHAYDIGLR